MAEQHETNPNEDDIKPGMDVDVTRGDLGEQDISKPKVAKVARNRQGQVKKVLVRKGIFFRKKLEIPAERIQSTDTTPQDDQAPGKVTIAAARERQARSRLSKRRRWPGKTRMSCLNS
jgi:hypothetical protein